MTDEINTETKEFIDTTFFQTLESVNGQLVRLEREEITMKQFRTFILEQRVWFAEQVAQFHQNVSLRATQLENSLINIGREILND